MQNSDIYPHARNVAERHGISTTSLHRHANHHLLQTVARSNRADPASNPDGLLDRMTDLESEARRLMAKAEKKGDLRTALSAVRELVRIVELLAKIQGELIDHPTVNVLVLPQWQRIETTILDVLGQHPELRTELAGRLRSPEAASDT